MEFYLVLDGTLHRISLLLFLLGNGKEGARVLAPLDLHFKGGTKVAWYWTKRGCTGVEHHTMRVTVLPPWDNFWLFISDLVGSVWDLKQPAVKFIQLLWQLGKTPYCARTEFDIMVIFQEINTIYSLSLYG